MSNNNQKLKDEKIIKEDFQKSLTHERPKPENTAPTSRPSDQQETQNQQNSTTSNDQEYTMPVKDLLEFILYIVPGFVALELYRASYPAGNGK